MAHHTNYAMPPNRKFFANDFLAGRTYIFDLGDPRRPRIPASLLYAGPYSHPHSFAYLANGNVLATYQLKGWRDTAPGALVELDSKGRVLRASDASDPHVDPYIRPYSLLPLEKIDRVVTTSNDMFSSMMKTNDSDVIQIWRLHDLKLLKTLVLPPAPKGFGGQLNADEAGLLSDGKTVLVKTASCGLYKLSSLTGSNPTAQFVYDFGYRQCASVPVVVGNYWIQPVFSGHAIVSVDVRDPAHPVEVSHLFFGMRAKPHWMSRERGTNTMVVTGNGSMLNRIYFVTVDPRTGALTLQHQTIDMNRKWPDGWNGPAIPHGTVFME
jgi:hypothetical protein